MDIRQATERDIPQLVEMAEAMHAESCFAHMPFSAKVTRETMRALVRARTGVIYLAAIGDEIIGVVAGEISRAMFSQEAVAMDKTVYMKPEYRGGQTDIIGKLLKCFCKWAAELGAVRITVCNSAGAPDDLFVAKLNYYGFKSSGSVMYLEVL